MTHPTFTFAPSAPLPPRSPISKNTNIFLEYWITAHTAASFLVFLDTDFCINMYCFASNCTQQSILANSNTCSALFPCFLLIFDKLELG